MPFHADEIADKEFLPSLRGYNRYEVRAFLRAVSAEYQRMSERRSLDVLVELRQLLSTGGPVQELAAPDVIAELNGSISDMLAAQEQLADSQREAAERLETASRQLDEALTELRWASAHVRHTRRSADGPPRHPEPASDAEVPRLAAVSRGFSVRRR